MLTAPFLPNISTSTAYGEERRRLCRACLDCPPDYSHQTVVVHDNAVMLNEVFEHCSPYRILSCCHKPVSLFILIDHSESMAMYDPKSKRYEAARALID